MTDVQYAVFDPPPEPGRVRAGRAIPGDRVLRNDPFAVPDDWDLPLPPAERHTPPPGGGMRLVESRDAAETARRGGALVIRVPRMPVRLIPQVDDGAAAGPGEAWGIGAVGADARPADALGQGVCVAVLDSGIDAAHPAFAGLIDDGNYRDFTGTGLTDNLGHGTHCAGIIFGRPVGGTRIGVAPGISKVLIGKIADRDFLPTTREFQEALLWAVSEGADIVSLSIGLDFLGHATDLENRGLPRRVALSRALNDYGDYTRFFDRLMGQVVLAGAAARSALVVAACGNDSRSEDAMRVAATLPSVAENVVAVGALGRGPDGRFTPAPFSNGGANICGPGVGILSAAPGGGLAVMSGTSQATPHVAGVAALWWQQLRRERFERPSPAVVREKLLGKASRERLAGEVETDAVGEGLAAAPD